jgi:hypothetical protein
VNLIDAEEQEMIGRDCDCNTDCNCEVVKSVNKDVTPVDCSFCFDKCICEEIGAEMKEMISDEEGSNRKDIIIEKKEEKFPKYTTMGFNRKEVETIFKGQFDVTDDSI